MSESVQQSESEHEKRGTRMYQACKSAAARLVDELDADTVIILVTKHTATGTLSSDYAQGNYFARLGHLRVYLTGEDEGERIQVRKDKE